MPEHQRSEASRAIEERLFALPEFAAARIILFFASFRSEVRTDLMIRRALRAGKRVILPRVAGAELELCEIHDFDRDTAPGAWGIPEPTTAAAVAFAGIELILVPGAAFDEQGNRIGYGAGFYDKLLAACTKTTVALAFENQIVPEIPAASHDVPVHLIVTEKRIIEARSA